MSLYLCIFSGEDEIDGIEVGSYSDFRFFRDSVLQKLENGVIGSRFPVLMLHSDCEGTWSVREAVLLQEELKEIAKSFKTMPAENYHSEWQQKLAKYQDLRPENLYECFIDVDGEILIERLLGLCQLSIQVKEPILFQ